MKTDSVRDNDLLDLWSGGSDRELLGHIQYLRNKQICGEELDELVEDADRMDEIRPLLQNRLGELMSFVDAMVEEEKIAMEANTYVRLTEKIRSVEYAADLVNVPVPQSIKWREK